MIRLKAIRPLACNAGRIRQGEVFDADQATALHLESLGLAERAYEPPAAAVSVILESIRSKMLTPPENKRTKKSKAAEPDKTAPGELRI